MQDIPCFQSFSGCIAPILPQKCGKFNSKMINSHAFDKKSTGKNALDAFFPACYPVDDMGAFKKAFHYKRHD
jgi:hypothetical protein